MRPEDKIALGFVDHGTVRGEFANDLFRLAASRPERFTDVLNVQDNLIARGRNEVVAWFLTTSADWLLFLDGDQRFTPEAYDALVEVADAEERPVLTGLYFGIRRLDGLLYPLPLPNIFSRDPSKPNFFEHIVHYPPNAVIRVDACGAGLLLAHRSVFEKISAINEPEFQKVWFKDHPLPNGDWLSEDIYFCDRAASAGVPIYCHTGVVSPHVKSYIVDDIHFEDSKVLLDSIGRPLK